jgi:hypothetical protein
MPFHSSGVLGAGRTPLTPQEFWQYRLQGPIDISIGVDVTKLVAYAVLAPSLGVDVTKLDAYSILAPSLGVDVTKLNAYAALGPGVLPDSSDDWWGGVALNFSWLLGGSLAAIQVTSALALQIHYQDEAFPGGLVATTEQDYWQNPTAPVPLTLTWPQQWPFDEQTPFLFAPPDELFWQNPVAPISATFLVPQPWFDAVEIGQPSVTFQPDEDFWQQLVAPIPATFTWPQQWTFDEQIPAGNLSAPPVDHHPPPHHGNPHKALWDEQEMFAALLLLAIQNGEANGVPIAPTTTFVIWIMDDFG